MCVKYLLVPPKLKMQDKVVTREVKSVFQLQAQIIATAY